MANFKITSLINSNNNTSSQININDDSKNKTDNNNFINEPSFFDNNESKSITELVKIESIADLQKPQEEIQEKINEEVLDDDIKAVLGLDNKINEDKLQNNNKDKDKFKNSTTSFKSVTDWLPYDDEKQVAELEKIDSLY